MSKMIFVSLPVTDLKASMAFYESIGFKNNPQFTDETAACMVWSEAINFMLLTHAKWRTFTSRPIPPKTSSEVMLALSCDSRDAVDAMSGAAAANGGTADINPIEDHGFMYTRDLADPDGHALGAMWMDMSAIPSGRQGGLTELTRSASACWHFPDMTGLADNVRLGVKWHQSIRSLRSASGPVGAPPLCADMVHNLGRICRDCKYPRTPGRRAFTAQGPALSTVPAQR